jgi:hypothetical protein
MREKEARRSQGFTGPLTVREEMGAWCSVGSALLLQASARRRHDADMAPPGRRHQRRGGVSHGGLCQAATNGLKEEASFSRSGTPPMLSMHRGGCRNQQSLHLGRPTPFAGGSAPWRTTKVAGDVTHQGFELVVDFRRYVRSQSWPMDARTRWKPHPWERRHQVDAHSLLA